MENEKKVIAAYTVVRYDNGSSVVDNAEVEGATQLTVDQIFDDIIRVARQIEKQRDLDMIRGAVFAAFDQAFTALNNQEKAAEVEAAMPEMTEKTSD